ncbi:MAG: UPF0721 transmembrane protein [Planctomycetaceae bacterium]|nr:MAG: UPF0721 transmembrane protein [Planctomycetaceae bacterium]
MSPPGQAGGTVPFGLFSCQGEILAGTTGHGANMSGLLLIMGMVVGLSLGLTGGGGAIFAVPMLVYGAGLSSREAVGISLAAVGATAAVGFVRQWWRGQVELVPGLMFALAGMVGAPLGTWWGRLIPDPWLLILFSGLMLVVAARMWLSGAQRIAREAQQAGQELAVLEETTATCQRDAQGQLLLTTRCTLLLFLAGVGAGILSGMFGVGGGFIIVPALVWFSHMPIRKAVGTSLMVVAWVALSGIFSRWFSGESLAWAWIGLFVMGGILGLSIGQSIVHRLHEGKLQRVFAVAVLWVAVFVLGRNIFG